MMSAMIQTTSNRFFLRACYDIIIIIICQCPRRNCDTFFCRAFLAFALIASAVFFVAFPTGSHARKCVPLRDASRRSAEKVTFLAEKRFLFLYSARSGGRKLDVLKDAQRYVA